MKSDDPAYIKEVNRKCAEMFEELKEIDKQVKMHESEIDALRERADKLFAKIDRLHEGRIV